MSYLLEPFTWGEREIVMRGLEEWVVRGKRWRAWSFEVGWAGKEEGRYPWLGWGDIGLKGARG